MDAALAQRVRKRARGCCEYCCLPQALSSVPFEIDHIIARKHGGKTTAANLAFSCFYCNSQKGPNIAGIDPNSTMVSRLFHPRRDRWDEHFRWSGATLIGLTPIGRATVEVLGINATDYVSLRASLIRGGVFPPTSSTTSSA